MKGLRITVIILFTFIAIPAIAQLKDSKWVATFNIPTEVSCYLQFGKDTLDMIQVSNDGLLEQMSYAVRSDTLTFNKLNGGSPCENDAKGIYQWKIEGNRLKLTMLSDDCEGRSGAGFDGVELQRVLPAVTKKE